MQMSRKAGLAKKIAHTLMAMSIVYSSGINIVVNQVYAGEKTENITGSSASFSRSSRTANHSPHSTNVHAAPCHRPVASQTIRMFNS